MNIFFRTDASVQMGTGHLMRCVTFADSLHREGANASFICRELPGSLCGWLDQRDYRVYRLPGASGPFEDAEGTMAVLASKDRIDWLVVDHYALDDQWESKMRAFAVRIMVIDDLADRSHNCDLLLDQNFYLDISSRYEGMVPNYCLKLLGPQYALLRPEFRQARQRLRERDGIVRRVMIFFGGSDPTNQTSKALRAMALLNRPDLELDVIIGASNPYRHEVENLAKFLPQARCHYHAGNMAELMAQADLYLGSAGTTTWELCCLGLPSLMVATASNQIQSIKDMAACGLLLFIGEGQQINERDIHRTLELCLSDAKLLKEYSQRSLALVDGQGTDRCVSGLYELTLQKDGADGRREVQGNL